MTYGYVRVSTKEQIVDRQLVAMKAAGVTNVTVEKASGKDFNRPQYLALKKKLVRGDLLVVQSLDRFGRNYDDIIDEWRYLVKTVGVDVKVLDMPLLDTRQGEGLIGRFVGDIVLQILSFVAETERMKIKERQAQGIKCAKERGVRFGRPRANLPDNLDELLSLYGSGGLTLREAAEEAGMAKSTFYRAAVAAGIRLKPVRRVRSPGRMAKVAEAPRPAEKDGRPSVEWVMLLPARERWQYAQHWTAEERRRAIDIEKSRMR